MAKTPSVNLPAQRRAPPPAKPSSMGKAPVVVAAAPAPAKKRTTPIQFYNEVRAEARKITWTTWKETWITSAMVGVMVVITAVFFVVVDGGLNFFMQMLLKLAAG